MSANRRLGRFLARASTFFTTTQGMLPVTGPEHSFPRTGVEPTSTGDTTTHSRVGDVTGSSATSFSWNIHALVSNAIERVDNKAWIVVTLDAGTVAAIYNLSDAGDPLGGLGGAPLSFYRLAIFALACSALLALSVVFPALGPQPNTAVARLIGCLPPRLRLRRALQPAAPLNQATDFLYFGHLRSWNEKNLMDRLHSLTADVESAALARHVLALSKIAWRKYRLLQAALAAWSIAATTLTLVGALSS